MPNASLHYRLEDITGKHDVKTLKRELDTLPGVCSVSIQAGTSHLTVDFDKTALTPEQIAGKLSELGFSAAEVSQ